MSDIAPWITVGELEKAFAPDSNSLLPVANLSGKAITLHCEDGRMIEYRFADDKTLVWTVTGGEESGDSAEESYYATNPRPDIYFVDFLKHRARGTSVTLVLDLGRGIFTALIGELPTRADVEVPFLDRIAAGIELTSVKATFLHGAIDAPFNPATPRHETTAELIGKRVEYTYSLTEQYEHLYLNRNYYTWHCLRGAEQGLADTDRCHYFKLGDQFYLFVWREKIIPTLGVVLVDLAGLRTTGKAFGYQGNDFGRLSNFSVGTSARVVSVLRRDL
jgi:hypothetical protein